MREVAAARSAGRRVRQWACDAAAGQELGDESRLLQEAIG